MSFRGRLTQTKFFRALIVFALLSAVFFLRPHFLMKPLGAVATTVSWPIEQFFSAVAFRFKDVGSFLFSVGNLKSENERLVRENLGLLSENARFGDVEKENHELRQELELLPRQNFQLRAAEVIGRDVSGLGNWIEVNVGSLDGLSSGMAVIVEKGVLVGRVTEVFPKSARVMLLSNPESLISGVTLVGGAQGIVKGEHGLGMLFDMVLQDDVLKTSDTLVTSGLGGELPKGLLIGTLQDTRLSSDHLFQQASVASPLHFDALRYVFIIQNVLHP